MEMIAEALERFNEYMRAKFLEWHIDFLMRRMEKMDIVREAQDLKAAKARSTCVECEEHDHVQGKPRFNASLSIQDLVPLCTHLKDFMDKQAKINKDTVTKFEAMEKILEI
jgi:Uri superfamily endonuclease